MALLGEMCIQRQSLARTVGWSLAYLGTEFPKVKVCGEKLSTRGLPRLLGRKTSLLKKNVFPICRRATFVPYGINQ